MIDLLMRKAPVVLQDVVVLDALRDGDSLRHRQHLGELVVGNVVEFGAMVFGYDKLHTQRNQYEL